MGRVHFYHSIFTHSAGLLSAGWLFFDGYTLALLGVKVNGKFCRKFDLVRINKIRFAYAEKLHTITTTGGKVYTGEKE